MIDQQLDNTWVRNEFTYFLLGLVAWGTRLSSRASGGDSARDVARCANPSVGSAEQRGDPALFLLGCHATVLRIVAAIESTPIATTGAHPPTGEPPPRLLR